MVPTLTVLKLDFKNLEFFRWSIGVVTDVLECRLSVAPWRKTKQGHACKKPGKQNGKHSNSNNKIHTNKLKKKGHAKTTMPHGAILWQIITKKLLLSSTERRRSNN